MRFIGYCFAAYCMMMMALVVNVPDHSVSASAPLVNATATTQRLLERYLANPTPQAFNATAPSLNTSLSQGGQPASSQLETLARLIESQNPSSIQLGASMLPHLDSGAERTLTQSLSEIANMNPNGFLQALKNNNLSSNQLNSLSSSLNGLSFNGGDLMSELSAIQSSSFASAMSQAKAFFARMKSNLQVLVVRVKREMSKVF